jgi:hypothetical protein
MEGFAGLYPVMFSCAGLHVPAPTPVGRFSAAASALRGILIGDWRVPALQTPPHFWGPERLP